MRVRPQNDGCDAGVRLTPSGLSVNGNNFQYPNVYEGSDQSGTFDSSTANLLKRFDEGYSCTLLAYGQTGSGKTYTMFGPPGSLTEAALNSADGGIPLMWGMFPRLCLMFLEQGMKLHASAIEIYAEGAYDLLNDLTSLKVASGSYNLQTKVKSGKFNAFSSFTEKDMQPNGSHPTICNCTKCFTRKEKESEDRIALIRSGAYAESKAKERESKAKSAKEDETSTFKTVGETWTALTDPTAVATLARTIETSRTAHGHALNARR